MALSPRILRPPYTYTPQPPEPTPMFDVLRLSFDGPNGSSDFYDSSTNAYSVVRSGDAELSTVKSNTGVSSMYTTDGGAQVTTSTAFFASADWEIEMWVWANSMTGFQTLFGTMALAGSGLHICIYSGALQVNNGVSSAISHNCDLTTQWNHIKIVRSQTTGVITLFLNGVEVGTTSQTPGSGRGVITIGPDPGAYSDLYYAGYIDDVRVSSPTTTTPAALLLHFNGDFVDSSVNNFAVTATGGATTTTAQSKFGGASLLSGPGWAYVDNDTATDLGSGDWTIELWYYQTGGGYTLAGAWGDTNAWFLGHNSLYLNNANIFNWTAAANDAWHHVAVVRKSDVVSVYLDGTMIATAPFTDPITPDTSYIGIGRDAAGNGVLYGYIDDFRMVKGLAVYDGDFVPPTAPLSADVALYTPYKLYGTLLFSECVAGDLVGTYADGLGGRFTETISVGSCP